MTLFSKISLTALLLAAPHVFAANILSIDPVSQNVAQGDTFDLNVRIDSVVDLSGYQFDLFYNSALVSLNTIFAGTILNPLGQVFIPGTDDTLGTIAATASAATGPGGVTTSNGLLATFRFNALNQGTATFSIDNILLTNSIGDPISPGVPVSGAAIIGPPSNPVPEPSALLLSAGGFAALALLRRRRSA